MGNSENKEILEDEKLLARTKALINNFLVLNGTVEVILLVGPACSGKSTASRYIEGHHGYLAYSMGEELRKKAETNQEIGRNQSNGKHVNNETVINCLFMIFSQGRKIVLDGVPRNEFQLKVILTMMNMGMIKIKKIFWLEADYEVRMERMLGRPDKRNDAQVEAFENRQHYYIGCEKPVYQQLLDDMAEITTHLNTTGFADRDLIGEIEREMAYVF